MAGKKGGRPKGSGGAGPTSYGQPGGNKRGPGNKGSQPETFKARMRLIASRAKTVKNVETILENPDHPQFMRSLEFAANRGFGPVPTEITGQGGGPVTVKVVFGAE